MEDDDKLVSPEVVGVPFSVNDHSRLKHPNVFVNGRLSHTYKKKCQVFRIFLATSFAGSAMFTS
jgi:hypothetical protein